MHLFNIFLANLILVKIYSCSRLIFRPISEEIETTYFGLIDRVSEFIEKALEKIEKGTFYKKDLEKLLFYTQCIIELKKQYHTPPVYWGLRKG